MKKITILIGVFLLTLYTSSFAEVPQTKGGGDIDEASKEMRGREKRYVEEMRRREEEHLQELKKINPEAYQRTIEMRERAQIISDTVSSYNMGKIDESQARRKLTPLIREMLKERLSNLDRDLEMAEKRVEYLRKVKKNPDILVDEQVNRYLGKPSSEEIYF